MLIYRWRYDIPPPPPSYPHGSVSPDPTTEKAVLAMKQAHPYIEPQDLLSQYSHTDRSIDKIIDYLLIGQTTDKFASLNDIPTLYPEDVLKAYVAYHQPRRLADL